MSSRRSDRWYYFWIRNWSLLNDLQWWLQDYIESLVCVSEMMYLTDTCPCILSVIPQLPSDSRLWKTSRKSPNPWRWWPQPSMPGLSGPWSQPASMAPVLLVGIIPLMHLTDWCKAPRCDFLVHYDDGAAAAAALWWHLKNWSCIASLGHSIYA